jgi:predicted AAA+ superfamily ATPase
MERSLLHALRRDVVRKYVLLTGPRQSGKTTLSRRVAESHEYINFDYVEHRTILREKSWDRSKKLIVFDELHKMKGWKAWLKGIYDVEGLPPGVLVTGSARLDVSRRAGDSLAGRYFLHHLHPFDIKEVAPAVAPEEACGRLLRFGGFPEPFLEASDAFYRRWRKTHLDIILRQDLVELESTRDLTGIETLIEMLRARVGTPLSHASLARDLQRDPKTVKRWIEILESLYVVFIVRPYHRNVARSILKEPRCYFFDIAQGQDDEGTRLENLVAAALLKEVDRLGDEGLMTVRLHYLRTKDGKEIDFALFPERGPPLLIEVKASDDAPSRWFGSFDRFFPGARKLQLVKELKREKTYPNGVEVRNLVTWLTRFDLAKILSAPSRR